MLECYDDGKLVNHGSIKLRLQHYTQGSFQDHSFCVIETKTPKTPKTIIVGHPASIRLGLITSFMQKHFKVCFSDRENDTKQHEKLLSRPSNMDRWQNPMEKTEEQI